MLGIALLCWAGSRGTRRNVQLQDLHAEMVCARQTRGMHCRLVFPHLLILSHTFPHFLTTLRRGLPPAPRPHGGWRAAAADDDTALPRLLALQAVCGGGLPHDIAGQRCCGCHAAGP